MLHLFSRWRDAFSIKIFEKPTLRLRRILITLMDFDSAMWDMINHTSNLSLSMPRVLIGTFISLLCCNVWDYIISQIQYCRNPAEDKSSATCRMKAFGHSRNICWVRVDWLKAWCRIGMNIMTIQTLFKYNKVVSKMQIHLVYHRLIGLENILKMIQINEIRLKLANTKLIVKLI